MNEQLLKDFIATAQKYNYNWNKAFGLFPELNGYNQQVLKDYVATAEKYNYDYGVVNSKFPELGFGEPSKKKEPTVSASKLEKPTSASSSKRRFEGVTEEPISQKKFRTDDYIDQVQNAQKKPSATNQKVESTFEQPKETKPTIKFDALSDKEAMQMMAEDFGKKEFAAYSSIDKIPSANKLRDLDDETSEYSLNKQFEGTNLEFKKIGSQLTVTSKIGYGINSTILNESTIDLSNPNADKELKSFVSTNLVKKSEREQFENAQSVEDLVELVGSNPNKFKASLLEGMDVDKYFEKERQLLNGEMTRAKADTYDSDLKLYEQKVSKFNQDVKGGKMSKSDFDARSAELENERKSLTQRRDIISNVIYKAEKIDKLTSNLEKANVITAAEREKQGSRIGLFFRGAGEGLTDVSQAMIDFGVAGAAAVIDAKTFADAIKPGEYERLKELGFSDDEIKNEIQKSVKNRANKVLRSVPDAIGMGTTEEYAKSADRGIIDQAIYAVGESFGAVGGGLAAGALGSSGVTAGFFAMSYNALEDQMRGPQFDALSENEKKIMSVPYGLVIGALEKLGAKVATGAAKNKTLGMFSEYIMAKTFSSLPKNASLLEIKSAINKSVALSVANGMLKITGAGIVEGGTEFTQQIFEGVEKDIANRIIQSNQLETAKEEGGGTVSKEIYNQIVQNKFFKDAADLSTTEGIGQLLKESGNAFLVGAVAGGMTSSISVGVVEPISNKVSNNKFAVYRDIILNDDAREGAISSINKRVEDNELTREEADGQIKSINESYPALRQIPTEFSVGAQREAFGLLMERESLNKEIADKDPNLVAKQKERVAEINEQLKGLSYAVQEQSADAVSVQSGAGVSTEVETGVSKTEPQGVTGETITEEVEVEGTKAEQPQAEVAQEIVESEENQGLIKNFVAKEATRLAEENISDEQRQSLVDKLYEDPIAYAEENAVYELSGGVNTDFLNSLQRQPAAQEAAVIEETPKPITKEEIETRRKETEAKIKNKDLFLASFDENGNKTEDSVGEKISQSNVAPVATSVREINGIEFVEFSNPETGDVDVVITGKKDGSYVGYYRLYDKSKVNGEDVYTPTNRWSSKFENQSRNKENFKTMIRGVQELLPAGHEYTEKTSISTDGLRVWNQQLDRGYELQYDENGNVVTNEVAINGDAIVNELGIPVNKGKFQNINVTSQAEFEKVKKALLPYLEKLGLNESNVRWASGPLKDSGTVKIDLPVLKKSTAQQAEVAKPTAQAQPTAKIENIEVTEVPAVEETISEVERQNNILTAEDFSEVNLSDKKSNKVAAQIVRAAKAISNVLPKVKFVVHSTPEAFVEGTKDLDGRASEGGIYDHNTKTIHINLKAANSRTVAHEVFHALILSKVASDAEARKLTRSMVKAVIKSLKQAEGGSEIISFLEDFESNYEANIQNEEKLSELFAILSDNYKSLPPATKNIIVRFLERMAKLVGIKPMTSNEITEFMNVLSAKVEAGEVISKKEVGKQKDGAVSETRKQKNEKVTQASERAKAQTRSKIDAGVSEAIRTNSKRENVKKSIEQLRDQGLLVTAQKGGGKMTNDEINAFMALSDAMANVWKQTTGQDNFYDTFVDQVKQGDLNAIKEKGGVLFQNIEIPQRPVSRVTLAVFELPEFKQMTGKEVSVDQVRNMIKSRGKQIERDIINEVLSYDKYQEKKMMFDVFRNDVEIQLMKLEPITTSTYATFGMDNLGSDQDYGNAETIVFNTPVDHGYTGHFGSDFSYGNLGSSTRWEVRQLPGVNQYVAIDADMPSGLAQEQIIEYVGTAGSKESVEKWIEKRKDILSDELNVGLFGHIRAWFNKGSGVLTLAEAQSDWFQKKKPADIFSSELTQEKKAEIDKIAKKAAEAETEKLADYLVELSKASSERYGLSVDLKKEPSNRYYELVATVKDSNGDILVKDVRTFTEDLPHGKYNEQELTTNALIAAIDEINGNPSGKYNALLLNKAKEFKDINEQELKDIDTILDYNSETNYLSLSSKEQEAIIRDLERQVVRWKELMMKARNNRTFDEANKNITELQNQIRVLNPNERMLILLSHGKKVVYSDAKFINDELNTSDYNRGNELSKQRKIAENNAIEEIKNSKKGDLILQQFLASAKVHELRLMRESFKHAAKKGATELWFPTPYTLAVIEGYVDSDSNGTGNAPYEIVDSRYNDELNQGDTINYEGDVHIVLDNDSTTITVADRDYVQVYDRDDYIYSEANDYYGDMLDSDFESQFPQGITRDDVDSGAYKRNETYSYIVQDEMESWFDTNTDDDVLVWNDISDDVINKIQEDLGSQSNEDLFGGYGNIYEGSYGTVYVVENNRELELLQPDQYQGEPTEEEGWEDNISDNQKTVVNKYKELNKIFEKLRPDAQAKVDDNGRTWISTSITAEDLMNPVIAFQNEGAKVKGAVDFSNDNKASVYIFDGADISTLAHEVSGHVGRRMLAKLAETDAQFKNDYDAAMKWAGARDGEWSAASEEKFARGLERYLQTGKAPFEELRNVFEKLRTWLTNIYKRIKGSSIDVKLTPEITKVFDNLLKPRTEQKFEPRKQKNSVDRLVNEEKKKGKTDQEIRDEAKAAGFSAKEASNALAKYYAKEEGVFVRSGKTGVTTKLYEGAKKFKEQYLKSKGLLPKIGFFLKEKMEGEISKETNRAVRTARKFGKMFEDFNGDKDLLLDSFDKFLRGDTTVKLPRKFAAVANEMRNHIDTLSKMLINVGAVEGEMADIVSGNIGAYLTRSYEIYDNKNWRDDVAKKTIVQAKNFLRSQQGMIAMATDEAAQKNITVDEALDILVDNAIDDIFTKTEVKSLVSGQKLGSKDLSTLKEREDIPEQIRMLMGEYPDSAMNYARTVNSLIHLGARHKFLTDIRKAGLGKFFFEKNDAARPTGFNAQISAEGSKVMAPLNGLYTTPEIVQAFNQEFGEKETSKVMKFLYGAMGLVKWLKTIASFATHAKNVVSNLGFVMVNGHNITKLYDAFKVVKDDLKVMGDADIQKRIDEYIEAGIMRQGAGINEIRDMFKDANLDKYLERRLSNKKSKGRLGRMGQYLMTKGISTKIGLENAYQAEDDLFKIAAYENEVSRYANALYGKKPQNLTPDEKTEVSNIAAENVKNTYPTYSRIPEGIKRLRKIPLFVGSFISFQAESYRTAFNTIALAKDELSSDNKKIKMIGATRVAGATAYLGVKTAILSHFGMAFGTGLSGVIGYFSDDDDEREKEKDLREFLPPWSKNSDIIVKKNTDGTIEYIDFSASDPHGGINKALNAFFSGDDLLDSFTKSVLGVVEQFQGPDITVQLAMQIYNNADQYGNKIYNPEDTFANNSKKITDYIYDVIEPGTLTSTRKLIKEDDTKNVIIGELTGVKTRKIDVKQQFGFKLAEFDESFKDIKKVYNSEYYKTVRMMEDPKSTKKEIEEQKEKTKKAYENANALYNAKTQEMMKLINSANKLGVDYDAVMEEVKARKVINQYNLFEIEQGRPAIIEEKLY